MSLTGKVWMAAALLCAAAPTLSAQSAITPDTFNALRALIRPLEGESRWREIDWLTSLREARLKAAQAIITRDPVPAEALKERLKRPFKSSQDERRVVLQTFGAEVVDATGKFIYPKRPPKDPPPRAPRPLNSVQIRRRTCPGRPENVTPSRSGS